MSEWLWGCMILSFKVGIGILCWSLSIFTVLFILGCVLYVLTK
jgi:hypothetical protein